MKFDLDKSLDQRISVGALTTLAMKAELVAEEEFLKYVQDSCLEYKLEFLFEDRVEEFYYHVKINKIPMTLRKSEIYFNLGNIRHFYPELHNVIKNQERFTDIEAVAEYFETNKDIALYTKMPNFSKTGIFENNNIQNDINEIFKKSKNLNDFFEKIKNEFLKNNLSFDYVRKINSDTFEVKIDKYHFMLSKDDLYFLDVNYNNFPELTKIINSNNRFFRRIDLVINRINVLNLNLTKLAKTGIFEKIKSFKDF